jgi:hypothetical protein
MIYKMKANEMIVDEMTIGKVIADRMTVYQMTV